MSTLGLPPDTRWLGQTWRHLGTCTSTSDVAAAWAREATPAPHGAIVLADAQTRGRGRLGRVWDSPPGDQLYFSLVLRPPLEPRHLPPLVLAVGVALAEAFAALGAAPELKWPNDVLLRGKKAAGILTELVSQGQRAAFVIVGIGVNLCARAFPPELATIATSLETVLGHPISRAAFLTTLCPQIERWHDTFVDQGPAPILAAWKRHAQLLGRRISVTCGDEIVTGIAEDLDAEGRLLVRCDNGQLQRVVAGDLT